MDKTSFKSDEAVEEVLSLAGGPESKKATGTNIIYLQFAVFPPTFDNRMKISRTQFVRNSAT